MILIDNLTKRGQEAYEEIMSYLNEQDFLNALLTTMHEDINKNKCFKFDVKYWTNFNQNFTSSERILFNSWINKFGLLPLQSSLWEIYKEYQIKHILNKIKN